MDELRPPAIDETWRHTKTGGLYRVTGFAFNTISDELDVVYAPLTPGPFEQFTRQMLDHPKAWLSLNEDGSARFTREASNGAG